MYGAGEWSEVFHDSDARQVFVVVLAPACNVSVPAHLPLHRPVGQRREAVLGRRRAQPRDVGRRAGGDVAVSQSHDDLGLEVSPLDGRSTRQRRRNVVAQSQLVAASRRANFSVAELIQPFHAPRPDCVFTLTVKHFLYSVFAF